MTGKLLAGKPVGWLQGRAGHQVQVSEDSMRVVPVT